MPNHFRQNLISFETLILQGDVKEELFNYFQFLISSNEYNNINKIEWKHNNSQSGAIYGCEMAKLCTREI